MRMFGKRDEMEDGEARRSLAERLLGRELDAVAGPPAADTPHRPVNATYDPLVPAGRGAEPEAAPENGTRSAPPQPTGPATRPVSRPPARLISRPGAADARPSSDAYPQPDAPLAAPVTSSASADDASGRSASQPRRRRAWDLGATDPGGSAQADPAPAPPAGEAAPASRPGRAPAPDPQSASARDGHPDAAEIALARAHLERLRQADGPAAPAGQAGDPQGRAGTRARTRVLGFHAREMAGDDPLAHAGAATQAGPDRPVGWIVVTDGPGRGASFTLVAGVSSIGRSPDQAIALDFGDLAISRENHASIAYDDRENRFLLGHGGKANLVRLNGRPVVSTEDLAGGDEIAIGDTVLRFVAFCGGSFSWTDAPGEIEPQEAGASPRDPNRMGA